MTALLVMTLQDAIQEALEVTCDGTTREVIGWLETYRNEVLDDNAVLIRNTGLNQIIRSYRKRAKTPRESVTISQICMDFGLPELDIDRDISVTGDEEPVWVDINDATIDDLDRHAAMLEEQSRATAAKARNIRLLRQTIARIVPGRTDIPIRELRRIARESK